ncbi:OmpA family protein [Pseudozobellia thermophila]|uniref:OmpA family protein n=1 Tax=Pseudozobellia thermophila TaxID=192903 RepID=A0A1M6KMW0_9FLAO|nr:OmpA family protein [Pseudozobellia thermophila]SHJ60275.1 OmpA family protein [Pseudozobellia thermophila]
MKLKLFISFFILTATVSLAQEFASKGDQYFYSYAYEDAIREYHKQMAEGKLMSNHQLLNLADSYFKTRQYDKAAKLYVDINKNDTIMSNHRFNKMLQSLAKTSEKERVKAFLRSKGDKLANELIENAEFNYQLLESPAEAAAGFFIFTVNANSEHADFSPSFYKDKVLFSSSRKSKAKKVYGPSGESYLDIYVADRDKSDNLNNVSLFKGIPNSPFHKSTPYYVANAGSIYYVLSNSDGKNLVFDDKGKNALAIGMAYDNGYFRFLLKDLSTSFYYPFYDEKSERLYFSANFEDSYGGTDIYYVVTNNGQVMSQPINLGPRINTPGNEIAPYVYDNSLYFSSDVFYGLGGMDVYRSNILSDDTFSIPVNLGAGINTKYDEFGFIIEESEHGGLAGYFSSNRPGGKGGDDIYGFKVGEKPGPRTLVFRGKVVKPQYDVPIADVDVSLVDAEGKVLTQSVTDKNGDYHMEIPYTDRVSLKIAKKAYASFEETYNPKSLAEIQKAPLLVRLEAIEDVLREREGKTVLDINDFYFASGRSEITPEIGLALDEVVKIVTMFPEIRLSIETHTDSRGGRYSNKRISEKRSEAIKKYLLEHGVADSNITKVVGYGEEKILNNCTDGVYCLDFLHRQNLRTLFVVENYEELTQ